MSAKEIDNVNHPTHYDGTTTIECIDAMRLIFSDKTVADFCLCNAFKYLWRHKSKNGKEDLMKAKWYLDEADGLQGYGDDNGNRYQILKELVEKAYEETKLDDVLSKGPKEYAQYVKEELCQDSTD